MKIKNILSAAVSVAVLTSCAVTTPMIATNNEVGSKIGRSTTICLFTNSAAIKTGYNGMMLNNKCGIIEAAKKGKISKIGLVDIKIDDYIFFCKKEYIVSGE